MQKEREVHFGGETAPLRGCASRRPPQASQVCVAHGLAPTGRHILAPQLPVCFAGLALHGSRGLSPALDLQVTTETARQMAVKCPGKGLGSSGGGVGRAGGGPAAGAAVGRGPRAPRAQTLCWLFLGRAEDVWPIEGGGSCPDPSLPFSLAGTSQGGSEGSRPLVRSTPQARPVTRCEQAVCLLEAIETT